MFIFLLFAQFFDAKEEGWHFYRDVLPVEDQPKTISELKKNCKWS
jgi:hypothetical protein